MKVWTVSDEHGRAPVLAEVELAFQVGAGRRDVHLALLGGTRPDPRMTRDGTTRGASLNPRSLQHADAQQRQRLTDVRSRVLGTLKLWNPVALAALARQGGDATLACSSCGQAARAGELVSLSCPMCGALLVMYGRVLPGDVLPRYVSFSIVDGVPTAIVEQSAADLARGKDSLDDVNLPFVCLDRPGPPDRVLLLAL
jgi:hypothetical protein